MPYIQSVDRYVMPTIDTEIISLKRAQEDFCFLALRTKWGLNELNLSLIHILLPLMVLLLKNDHLVLSFRNIHLINGWEANIAA